MPGPLSRLTPRPLGLGGGERTLSGGSTLAARRPDLTGTGGGEDMYPLGRAGTGGGSSFVGMLPEILRFGEGSLNDRSVIDPELFCRCNPPRTLGLALPLEDVDPRRCIRLVCISPTGVGVVVWERSAAAAAALERFALEVRLARKACAAAVDAAAVGVVLAGCMIDVSDIVGGQESQKYQSLKAYRIRLRSLA